jgi:apolipoprotein N-acyltransferase
MTERHAETIANVVIGVAALGAAVYVLKTPALRRMVWGLARTAVTAAGPAWLMAEARRGWATSGDQRQQPAI